MKKIYKYNLYITDQQFIEIPGEILSVANQNENIVLYALVNDNWTPVKYSILIVGTGNPIDDCIRDYKFLGTVPICNDKLMWHVFYK